MIFKKYERLRSIEDELNLTKLINLFVEFILKIENFNFKTNEIFQQKDEQLNPNKKLKIEISIIKKIQILKKEILIHLQKIENNEKLKNSIQILYLSILKILNIFSLNFIKQEEYQKSISILENTQIFNNNVFINEDFEKNFKQIIGIQNLLLSISYKLLNEKNEKYFDFIQKSIDFIPNSPLILFIFGSFLYDKNQFEESKSKFNQIIKMKELFISESLNMIGCIFVKQVI